MRRPLLAVAIATILAAPLVAQVAGSKSAKPPEPPLAKAAAALPFPSIGPGLMSGRLSDIAVHPTAPGLWYVAAGSGGVWKTTNAGTTWAPVFENQPSYSIGEITLDPTNPDVVWVGTGGNVSGRHVGWGERVYRSRDADRTWQWMGLPRSEHIGRILVKGLGVTLPQATGAQDYNSSPRTSRSAVRTSPQR